MQTSLLSLETLAIAVRGPFQKVMHAPTISVSVSASVTYKKKTGYRKQGYPRAKNRKSQAPGNSRPERRKKSKQASEKKKKKKKK